MAQNYNVQVVGKFVDKISGPMSAVKAGIGALVATIGAIGGASLKVGSDMEQLTARLETATGSAENASNAMAMLTELNKRIPGNLEDTTNAFIQLTNLGLAPTEEAIMSYANTAAGMGKPLSQFVEAVADATTNEFERLKEFGIKTKSEGDKVSFTFQGITTTVGKNSQEIRDYLESLGNVQFAGATEKQMNTLKGLVSNAKDEINQLLNDIFQDQQLGEFAKNATRQFIEFVKVLRTRVGPVFKYLGAQAKIFFNVISVGFDNLMAVVMAVGRGIGSIIDALFGSGSSNSIVEWASNGKQAFADIQTFFLAMYSVVQEGWDNLAFGVQAALFLIVAGVKDLAAKSKAFIRIAALSVVSGFKRIPNAFHQLVVNIANAVIDGINVMITTTLNGVNKIIDAVNEIPGVEIDPVNVSENTIKRLEEVKDKVDDVYDAMVREEEDALADALRANADELDSVMGEANQRRLDSIKATQEEVQAIVNDAQAAANMNLQLTKEEIAAIEAKKRAEIDAAKAKQEADRKAAEEASKKKESTKEYIEVLDGVRETTQGVLSTFFQDIGNGADNIFSRLVDNFRNAINTMVADALAAKLVKSLFGEGDETGAVGGNSGFSSFATSLFGREYGGPVQANTPYIVGERRPEIFVPRVDGTILPSVSNSMGSNVNVQINAIDQRGVADFIEKNKFALTTAVQNTSRNYNVR